MAGASRGDRPAWLSGRGDRPAWLSGRRAQVGVLLLGLLLCYLFWPSPYRRVVNLAAPGEVVAVLGDSIPAGFGEGVGEERAWPALVSRRLGMTVRNFSVPGDTTEKGLARVDEVLAVHPRLVVVELGGNDLLSNVGAEKTRRNLVAIFSRLQQAGACVMFVGVPAPLRGEYEEAWSGACRERGVWYVPNILKGVIANRQLMGDALHPNAAGQQVLAERLEAQLGGLLQAADRRRGH